MKNGRFAPNEECILLHVIYILHFFYSTLYILHSSFFILHFFILHLSAAFILLPSPFGEGLGVRLLIEPSLRWKRAFVVDETNAR